MGEAARARDSPRGLKERSPRATPSMGLLPLRQAGSGRPAMDGHVGKTGPPEVNSVFLVLTRFKNKLKSRHSLKIMNRAGEQSFACVFISSSVKLQFKN